MREKIILENDSKTTKNIRIVLGKLKKTIKCWTFRDTSKPKGRYNLGEGDCDQGVLTTKHQGVEYIVSKEYCHTTSYVEGACPIFGDGGTRIYSDHYDYALLIKPSKKNSRPIEFQEKDVALYDFWEYGEYELPDKFGVLAHFYERNRLKAIKANKQEGRKILNKLI